MFNEKQTVETVSEIQEGLESELNEIHQETSAFLLQQATRANAAVFKAIQEMRAVSQSAPKLREALVIPIQAGVQTIQASSSGEQVLGRLFKAIEALANTEMVDEPTMDLPLWTGSKAGLVELAYALRASKVIGDGYTPLYVIVRRLERAFHVRIDNHARIFQELLYRKKGYTVFLDQLKGCLLAYIDDNDGRHAERNKSVI